VEFARTILGSIFRNLDWSVLTGALISIIPALLCITFHELAHGYTAYRLGDRTAKDMGRLTLNPIRHIDIFGLIMMVIFGFGWAKPVPVNMSNFKKPKRDMAITALAGPLSNVILSAVVLLIFGLVYSMLGGSSATGGYDVAISIIHRTAYISIALAVFNVIPIPPLDGSKVLFSVLPEGGYYKLMRYERFGIILLILVLNTDFFGRTIGALTKGIFDWLFGAAQFTYELVN